MSTTPRKEQKTYSERMVSQYENDLKLKDSDRYVNNVGNNLTKERTLSSQVSEYNYFSDRHRSSSSNLMPDTSFYIDKSAITGNNSNVAVPYVNNNDNGQNIQENILSGQVSERIDFSTNVQNNFADKERISVQENEYATVPISYSGAAKSTDSADNVSHASTYEQNKVLNLENSMKLSDTEHYVNSDVDGKDIQKSILSGQVHERIDFSTNVQNNLADKELISVQENEYATVPISYSGAAKSTNSADNVSHASTYEQDKVLNLENSMKLSDTEHYVNSNVGGKDIQKSILSGQVHERIDFSDNIQNNVDEKKSSKKPFHEQLKDANVQFVNQNYSDFEQNGSKETKVKHKSQNILGKGADIVRSVTDVIQDDTSGEDVLMEKSYALTGVAMAGTIDISKGLINKAVESVESIKSKYKINAGDEFLKDREKIDKFEFENYFTTHAMNETAGQQILEKLHMVDSDFVKDFDYYLYNNATFGDKLYARKALGVHPTKDALKEDLNSAIHSVTKFISGDMSMELIASFGGDMEWQSLSNDEKRKRLKKQVKDFQEAHKNLKLSYKGFNPYEKEILMASSNVEALKLKLGYEYDVDFVKNKKGKKTKEKKRMQANKKAYIKDATRVAVIKNLIKPESDRENNLSTGFGGFVVSIAKRFMDDFFKGMIKWLLGLIGQIILFVATSLASLIVTLMPIILPIGAAVGVICGLFSFMFGDNTTAQADASYCTTILNNKYNDFNKASHDWLDNNTDTVRGYNVVYADDCSGVNNFQDALLLYIIFSTDNVSSDSSDDSYLVVDSDTEKSNLDKAFNMLTYAETSDKTRTVHRKTLADVESSLTDNQKKMLELERELVADGSSFDLGDRVVGDYADDVGLGSDLIASDLGQAAADYGCKFIGNKYVWGGTDINNGIDCSGFTQYVCGQFGILLPRTSREQVKSGQAVASLAEAKPGDLIFYSRDGTDSGVFHVTMYIGNNQMVHASNSNPYPRGGIKISNVYGSPYKIRRVFN